MSESHASLSLNEGLGLLALLMHDLMSGPCGTLVGVVLLVLVGFAWAGAMQDATTRLYHVSAFQRTFAAVCACVLTLIAVMLLGVVLGRVW